MLQLLDGHLWVEATTLAVQMQNCPSQEVLLGSTPGQPLESLRRIHGNLKGFAKLGAWLHLIVCGFLKSPKEGKHFLKPES